MRYLFMVFALLCYALFFATFLYLIGFVANLPGLGMTIDGPATSNVGIAVMVDLTLVAVFGLQHSIMARQGFKKAWTRIVPEPIERSVYVLAASLVLIILSIWWQPVPIMLWQVENATAAGILWAIFGLGWIIVLLSTFLISHFELFGLKQALSHLLQRAAAAPRFYQPFFYRFVRHPLYLGFLLAFWVTPAMSVGHLLFAAAMTAYILIAIRYEERDLIGLFGDDYRAYQRDVGMLAPRLRR